MLVLAVAAACPHQIPTILSNQFNDVSNFHSPSLEKGENFVNTALAICNLLHITGVVTWVFTRVTADDSAQSGYSDRLA